MPTLSRLATPFIALLLGACAAAPAKRDPRDPFERVNRSIYKFNDGFDRAVAKPIAHGYRAATPQFVRTGVSNFFDNLHYPTTIVNDVLQAKVKSFFSDTGRFVLNSTLGVGGLFDPATSAGLDKNTRDLGQTFGKWGIGTGPYLMLPFLGPTDVRDAVGRGGDTFTTPQYYLLNFWPSAGLFAVEAVDTRYRLLSTDAVLDAAYDRYAFIRNAYLQRRQFMVTGSSASKEEEDEQKLFENLENTDQDGKTPPKE